MSAIEVTGGPVEHQALFAAGRDLFEQVALAEDFVDFPTLPAYDLIRD